MHPGNVSRDMRVLFQELPVIARRHGIPVDIARHHRWAAWSARTDGRRWDAIRSYARAVPHGDVASIGRAAVTLVARRPSATVSEDDTEWLRRAQRWLSAFSSPSAV
jgi:hypothetical protein